MILGIALARWLAQAWTLPLTGWTPYVLPAWVLHRAALRATTTSAGSAGRLLERAALAYQLDGDLDGLACLRAHRRSAGAVITT